MESKDRRRLILYLLDHAEVCDECAFKLDDLIADVPIQDFQLKPNNQMVNQ